MQYTIRNKNNPMDKYIISNLELELFTISNFNHQFTHVSFL